MTLKNGRYAEPRQAAVAQGSYSFLGKIVMGPICGNTVSGGGDREAIEANELRDRLVPSRSALSAAHDDTPFAVIHPQMSQLTSTLRTNEETMIPQAPFWPPPATPEHM